VNRLFFLVIPIVFLGCAIGEDTCFPVNFNPGITREKLRQHAARAMSIDGNDVRFIIVNNPYCLTQNDQIYIFMDRWCVFSGTFSNTGVIKVPDEVIEQGNTHVILYVVRGGSVSNFEDKSIIPIDIHHRYLYICFFPTNENSDRVHFFPQDEACVQ
jgi:hypothetical protein